MCAKEGCHLECPQATSLPTALEHPDLVPGYQLPGHMLSPPGEHSLRSRRLHSVYTRHLTWNTTDLLVRRTAFSCTPSNSTEEEVFRRPKSTVARWQEDIPAAEHPCREDRSTLSKERSFWPEATPELNVDRLNFLFVSL